MTTLLSSALMPLRHLEMHHNISSSLGPLGIRKCAGVETNLRDTLLVHPSVEGRPGDFARVLALEEKGLGLAILEAEDLAVTTDVELSLCIPSAIAPPTVCCFPSSAREMVRRRAVTKFRHLAEGRWEARGWQGRTLPG